MLRPCRHPFLSFAVPTHTLGRDKAARQAVDRELLEWQQQRAARLGLRWPQNARRAARPSFGRRCVRWSRPLEMIICLNTLSRPCYPGGGQACRSEPEAASDVADAPCWSFAQRPASRQCSQRVMARAVYWLNASCREKTRACGPTNVYWSILTKHTESHWSSNATLFDFVEFMDKTWFNPQEPPDTKAWVLLWDVYTTHTSRKTLAELRSRVPHVRVTFLPPGSTSHTQPCDMSYMRAPKAVFTRAAASHLVSSLIMNPDAAVVLKHPSMELKRMFLGWPHTTLAEK